MAKNQTTTARSAVKVHELDQPQDFSEEVLADWRADKKELFERRWPEVQTILRYLEGYGIYMLDVHPGNISFGD